MACGAREAGGDASVLFVCLGNICRSPTAEAVFREKAKKRGVVVGRIDSCGTGGGSSNWFREGGFSYHEGEPPDGRMTAAARKRGIDMSGASRPLTPGDFSTFRYIVGMDESNKQSMLRALEHWREHGLGNIPRDAEERIVSMADFIDDENVTSVPDPYYGGERGFELVLDLLDGACENLVDAIERQTE